MFDFRLAMTNGRLVINMNKKYEMEEDDKVEDRGFKGDDETAEERNERYIIKNHKDGSPRQNHHKKMMRNESN